MASEVTTEVRVQRSIQRFSFVSKTQTTTYYANLRAIGKPHDILTWNAVVSSVDEEEAYPPGTALSIRGRLAPGSKGSMFELHATEHLRLDRTLDDIPSTALFTAFGEVLTKSHYGEDCLVIQTDPDGPALFAVLKKHLPDIVFDAIDLQDAVRVVGTFDCTLQPYNGDQVLLSLHAQDLTVTGRFSRYPMYENTRSERSGSTGEASALFVAEDDAVDDIPPPQEDPDASLHLDEEWVPTWSQDRLLDQRPPASGWNLRTDTVDVPAVATHDERDDFGSSLPHGDAGKAEPPSAATKSPLGPWSPRLWDRQAVNMDLRRIPDVASPWSSPVMSAMPLKRRAEDDASDQERRKRPRWNGSVA